MSKATMTDTSKSAPPFEEDDQPQEYPYAIVVDAPPPPPVQSAHSPVQSPPSPARSAPMSEDQEDDDLEKQQEIMVGRWEVGFCSCCTDCVPNCCMVTWCPCVSLAQISERLGIAPYECSLVTLVLLNVFTLFTIHIVFFTWIWKARVVTRQRFQLPGDMCGDFFAALCCPCCTLAQIATHIKSYKPGSCDFGPVDTLPPYQCS